MEVGVDIIEIDRIERAIQKPRFIERVYTEAEQARCERKRDKAESYAGRFASKEAVVKCLGQRVPWKQIEIINDPNGKPKVTLHGRAKELAKGRNINISISHSREFAVAFAVMENDLEPDAR